MFPPTAWVGKRNPAWTGALTQPMYSARSRPRRVPRKMHFDGAHFVPSDVARPEMAKVKAERDDLAKRLAEINRELGIDPPGPETCRRDKERGWRPTFG